MAGGIQNPNIRDFVWCHTLIRKQENIAIRLSKISDVTLALYRQLELRDVGQRHPKHHGIDDRSRVAAGAP